jgi:hypothetical protein
VRGRPKGTSQEERKAGEKGDCGRGAKERERRGQKESEK